jgi:tetratricopeptide (TPR) repeat protein
MDAPAFRAYDPRIMPETSQRRFRTISLYLAGVALLCWIGWIGVHRWWRPILLVALAAGSLLVGSLIGFVFTSYSDEANTVGKVRDWIVGALAGVTLLKFRSLKAVILVFAYTNSASDFALALATSVVFACLGFFFMFFGRELIFNIPLAIARRKRTEIENTQEAGAVTLELISVIPSSILVGIDDADDLKNSADQNAKLSGDLYSPNVNAFLDQSQQALAAGVPLDWDIVSKVAYLQYYRAYFAKPEDKEAQQQCAYDWILRALIINPQHVDFAVKRADVLALMSRWSECVSILEALAKRPECPFFVLQWLGYYVLYLRGREDEAIEASQKYLALFSDSNESRRNLACGYGQRVCRTAGLNGTIDTGSVDYQNALANLRIALQANPNYAKVMRTTWIEPGGSFSCFKQDSGYRKLVGLE